MRHYTNLRILYSVLTEFRSVGPFDLNWETQQYKCWISQIITFGLLAALQLLNLFWFFLICRILYRFVARIGLADERSDEEDEEEESAEGAEDKEKAARDNVDGAKKTLLGRQDAPEVRLNGEIMTGSSAGEGREEVRSRRRG